MPFVAFDLGTLFSFDNVIETINDVLSKTNSASNVTLDLARKFFNQWYEQALRDYIASSQAGIYCPLLRVLKTILTRVLLTNDYMTVIQPLAESDIQTIMRAFDALEPKKHTAEALEFIKTQQVWDIWVLSIGSFEDTVSLLERTNLIKYVKENIICCDELRVSKPHPKVYSELMRMAVRRTKRIENFYMVGSYAFELASAKNVSLRTVFLDTTEKMYASKMYNTGEPDITGSNLVECVTKMIGFEKTRKHFIQPTSV